jgi:hypothetical protein
MLKRLALPGVKRVPLRDPLQDARPSNKIQAVPKPQA